MARVLIVHPPVTIARDFIDYPYFADLGAVQLAAVLRDKGALSGLVDAYALEHSSLAWGADGRALLGAPVEHVFERARPLLMGSDAIVVALSPFHRPPQRDEPLGALLSLLRDEASGVPLWLADVYQSGQHYVEAEGERVLASYPEADAWVKYEGEETIPELITG